MDLNRLYFDHQLLLMQVQRASSWHRRSQHFVSASHVAARIGRVQRALGARAAAAWEAASVVGSGTDRRGALMAGAAA